MAPAAKAGSSAMTVTAQTVPAVSPPFSLNSTHEMWLTRCLTAPRLGTSYHVQPFVERTTSFAAFPVCTNDAVRLGMSVNAQLVSSRLMASFGTSFVNCKHVAFAMPSPRAVECDDECCPPGFTCEEDTISKRRSLMEETTFSCQSCASNGKLAIKKPI